MRRAGGVVLLVGHVQAPTDDAPGLVLLLHRHVCHEAVGGGAVPVVLAGFEEHPVTGSDDLDCAALALAQADALGDEDRLPVRVGVPRGPRAGVKCTSAAATVAPAAGAATAST